jgi:hypothetical protein
VSTVLKKAYLLLCSLPLICEASEQLSPYSPAFFLNPYQIEWDSSAGYSRTNITVTSPFVQQANVSSNYSIAQGLFLGLPNNYSIGISEAYIKTIEINPNNPAGRQNGWTNPVLTGSKIWNRDSNTQAKLTGTLQPNMNVVPGMTNYSVALTGIYLGQQSWTSTLGLIKSGNDGGGNGVTTVEAVFSKELGEYLCNLTLDAARFNSSVIRTGSTPASYGYLGMLSMSRPVAKEVWVGINYSIASNINTYTQTYGRIEYNTRYLVNAISANVKVLF